MTAALATSVLALAPFALAIQNPPPKDDAQKTIEDMRKQLEEMRQEIKSLKDQQSKAPTTSDLDRAISDLSNRIELQKSAGAKGGANIMAPDSTSIKVTFDDRVRAEAYRNRAFGAVKDDTAGGSPNTLVTSVSPLAPTGTVTPGTVGGAGQNGAIGDATRILNRLRMNMNVDVDKNLEAFLQMQYSYTWGSSIGGGTAAGGSLLPNQPITPFVAPVAPGALASSGELAAGSGAIGFSQAYVVFKDIGDSKINMTMGRFALDLGQGRLLSSADWDNVGRSFDGFKFEYADDQGQWSATGYATKVVQGGLDFQSQDTNLYGGWVAVNPADGFKITPYTMWADNNSTPDSVTTAPPLVTATVPYMVGKPWTIGTLLEFSVPDSQGLKLYGDGAIQMDHKRPNPGAAPAFQGTQNVDFNEAYAYAIGATFDVNTEESKQYKPKVGIEQGRATKVFNDMYSAAHGNYGLGDFVSTWNNLNYWKFGVGASPCQDTELNLAYYTFRMADGIAGSSKDIGQEFDVELKAKCSDHINVSAGWAHFFTGKAFQGGGFVPGAAYATQIGGGTGTREDADFLFLTIAVRF
jgi:hypothetical protein